MLISELLRYEFASQVVEKFTFISVTLSKDDDSYDQSAWKNNFTFAYKKEQFFQETKQKFEITMKKFQNLTENIVIIILRYEMVESATKNP